MSKVPTPSSIAASLSKRVVGQVESIRELSVALSKHLSGLAVGNILLIGSSGTGKTTLMRAVEDYLAAHEALAHRSTVIRLHANVLGAEAEKGRSGSVVLNHLLERAREQLGPQASLEDLLHRVRHGLVFVDEVDKIRAKVGDQPHVAGIRAQEALLTLIENEAVSFELPQWAGGETIAVDSRSVLFVCAGAFEGLYDGVYDRVTVGQDRGALQAVTVVEGGQVRSELQFNLRDWLRHEDLFEYGMTPQFLARFDAIVLLENLGMDELVTIFLSAPDSAYLQSRAYFTSRGMELALSPAAVRAIAKKALAQPRLGARALKEIFRRVIRDYEFDPEIFLTDSKALLIDQEEVETALKDF